MEGKIKPLNLGAIDFVVSQILYANQTVPKNNLLGDSISLVACKDSEIKLIEIVLHCDPNLNKLSAFFKLAEFGTLHSIHMKI